MFKLLKVMPPLHKNLSAITSSPLRRRLIKGLSANAFGQVVNIGIQLTSVPIFLHFWGAGLYGNWLILSSIPAYLSMSDIGFGSVAGNEMTILTARQDYQAASKVFQSAWVFITSVCSVISLVVIALAYLLPFDDWFNLQPMPHNKVALVICLLALYTLVSQQGGLIDAAFRSDGRYAQGTTLANVVRFIEMALALMSVAVGGQLVAAALTLLIGRVMGLCWMWLMFRRGSQWLSLGYAQARWEAIQMMLRPAIAFMAFPMSQALIFQGMTLSVGAVLGPVAVVLFTTSRTVTRIVIQFITLINCAVWPEFSSAFGSGDLSLAKKLHQKAASVSLWLSVVVSIALVFIGPWLLNTWTNRQVALDITLFYLMLLLVTSNSIWQSSCVVLMAINKHGGLAKISLISSVLALAIAYLLLKLIGISGSPIALLAADILMGIYAIRKAIYVLKDTGADYLRGVFNLKNALT